MLYYIYIGNSQTAIDHLNKVTNGMFVAVSGARKAAKIIDGIRERYNTSILYEQTDTEKDCLDITNLRKRFPRVYIRFYFPLIIFTFVSISSKMMALCSETRASA